jgi:hypothetical protein
MFTYILRNNPSKTFSYRFSLKTSRSNWREYSLCSWNSCVKYNKNPFFITNTCPVISAILSTKAKLRYNIRAFCKSVSLPIDTGNYSRKEISPCWHTDIIYEWCNKEYDWPLYLLIRPCHQQFVRWYWLWHVRHLLDWNGIPDTNYPDLGRCFTQHLQSWCNVFQNFTIVFFRVVSDTSLVSSTNALRTDLLVASWNNQQIDRCGRKKCLCLSDNA